MSTVTAGVRLYELAQARDILDQFLGETEGEVTPELQQLLDELAGKTEEKIERVALYVREQLATAAAIDEEAKRLAARSASRKRAAEGLKDYLKSQMERLEIKKVDGLLCTIALAANPPSVRADLDEETLRNFYAAGMPWVKRVPESFALDRRAALDLHKAGGPLPDCISIEQGVSLRLR